MDTTTKIRKTVRNSNMVRLSDKRNFRKISTDISHSVTALSQSWKSANANPKTTTTNGSVVGADTKDVTVAKIF